MSAISGDVEEEFEDAAGEAANLTAFLARLDRAGIVEGSLDAWVAKHVAGSSAEKLYLGMERVMLLLASDVDRVRPDRSSAWHVDLLNRTGEPRGNRGAILSPTLCAALHQLRGFRHRERNSYAADLNLWLVIERAESALTTFSRFRDEVRAFLRTLPA